MVPRSLPQRGTPTLAAVARPPLPARLRHLERDGTAAGEIPAARTTAFQPRSPRVASPCAEEPDAVVLHVRICGGPGRVTARGYPTRGGPGSLAPLGSPARGTASGRSADPEPEPDVLDLPAIAGGRDVPAP